MNGFSAVSKDISNVLSASDFSRINFIKNSMKIKKNNIIQK